MQICRGLAQLAKAGMLLVFGMVYLDEVQTSAVQGSVFLIWVFWCIFGCSSVQCRFADDEVSGARSSQGKVEMLSRVNSQSASALQSVPFQ